MFSKQKCFLVLNTFRPFHWYLLWVALANKTDLIVICRTLHYAKRAILYKMVQNGPKNTNTEVRIIEVQESKKE
jgi:hypothetical protein